MGYCVRFAVFDILALLGSRRSGNRNSRFHRIRIDVIEMSLCTGYDAMIAEIDGADRSRPIRHGVRAVLCNPRDGLAPMSSPDGRRIAQMFIE